LALRLSMDLKTPELLAALKAFALGNRGPDRLRLEAAQVASQEGLMPSGMVKMWNQGEQKELLLMAMEISERPSVTHSKPVRQLAGEGILALKAGAAQKAESLFQEALALEPDSPDIKFNLVSTYQLQGRGEEARALLTKIHQDYPDYAFAPILLARQHLQKKEVEAAQKLLDPLLQRQHFHFQEFSQFCEAEIELSLAKKLPEAARTWLGMWERVAPDDAALSYWQKRLADKKSWFLK
jgi:tetratricopeptide (TPR) repeat protein